MAKVVKINEKDFKHMLREMFKEAMGESSNSGDSIKVFLKKDEMSFLEELLERLMPENENEEGMIRRIKTTFNDAQVNL